MSKLSYYYSWKVVHRYVMVCRYDWFMLLLPQTLLPAALQRMNDFLVVSLHPVVHPDVKVVGYD